MRVLSVGTTTSYIRDIGWNGIDDADEWQRRAN
jgi:hypothetical protein